MNSVSKNNLSSLSKVTERKFGWSAPSNIALVKYWGKKPGVQLPTNPSVSLTLEKARTKAILKVLEKRDEEWISLRFQGQSMPAFLPKIERFFTLVSKYFPFLKDASFSLETSNTFPHSAGIASSASSMAAMALCLVQLEEIVSGTSLANDEFLARASFFARLGSGSACRSIYPFSASWGLHSEGGSDEIASPVIPHAIFQNMRNTVVLVDQSEKTVSSRAGHGLMKGHLFGDSRNLQAMTNFELAHKWLVDGSWDMLGSLVEEEALSLHAMMMTSRPGYLLMKPESLRVIESVKNFRIKTKVPLYFTMDAGPNVHLLYPDSEKEVIQEFINKEILGKSEGLSILEDFVGLGPREEV